MKRFKESSIHLQRAYNKYGLGSFSFYILCICDEVLLNKKEIFYIKKYKSNKKEFGYNILAGGNVPPSFEGKKHSNETKEKMSTSALGNQRWLGKKHTQETKNKMSKSGVGSKSRNSSSDYIGVNYEKREDKWAAGITYKNKRIWIGYFTNEIDAALAYDKKAHELYGKETRLNFPGMFDG